jgi:hypothetical protein
MDLQREKFLAHLKVELEHLVKRITWLISQNRDRLQKHEETEHVCFENVAVLENEMHGMQAFLRVIDRIDVDGYADLDAMVSDLKKRFRDHITSCGLAEAAYVFAEKKIDYIRRYIEGSDVPGPYPGQSL